MDVINTYKCPCCGAPLVFKDDELHCESCDNKFPLETLQQLSDDLNNASKDSKYNWDVYEPRSYEDTSDIHLANYSCPSCGAQITGDDTLGSTVCPYCGQSTIVKGQFEGTLKPDFIIPFKIDKKAAIAAFEKEAATKLILLPDEFKDKKKIQEMAGIYVPFWTFDCDCDASIVYNGQRITVWSDANYRYTKTDFYKLYRSGEVGFENIPVNGSKKAEDAYMEALEPYNYEEAVNFSDVYLSGYLADKYDVSVQECVERANERVKNSTVKAFNETTTSFMNVFTENSSVAFDNGKVRYSLLPVWMLNIKYKNQMYKFAINGQTGKVVGEFPIDESKKNKYFLKVAGIAYVVFAAIAYFLLH